MSSTRQEYLRDLNKYLLDMLMQHKEKLKLLRSGNENYEELEEEKRTPSEDLLTLTGGDHRPARAALAGPCVKLTATCGTQRNKTQSNKQHHISKPPESSNHAKAAAGKGPKNLQIPNKPKGKKPVAEPSEGQRVINQADESEDLTASGRHRLQPLLGYDWIAGLLETEELLVDRTDDFFSDLHEFRSFYKNECVHNTNMSKISELLPPFPKENNDPEANKETHKCIFAYRINSRLFPVPLHLQEDCAVCKREKSSHPHTTAEPAHVRVSIPCANLLPYYEYKAHRRSSFDPSDSLGLPSHCLSDWPNKGQATQPRATSLDLRSSLKVKKPELQLKEMEELLAPKALEDPLLDWIPDPPRFTRLNFQRSKT